LTTKSAAYVIYVAGKSKTKERKTNPRTAPREKIEFQTKRAINSFGISTEKKRRRKSSYSFLFPPQVKPNF
jgi:hypothetical protein